MKRISTDAEYLDSGKLVIDADGVPFEPASKGYVDQRVPITGTGSPERKVAAPVGSVYVDAAATNGAIRWIKSSGAGSTGWRVEYGDTGWRDISASLVPGLIEINAGGHIQVRRIGPFVEYSMKNFKVNTLGNLWQSPAGFGAEPGRDGQAVLPDGGTAHVTQYWLRIEGFTPGTNAAVYRAATVRFIADPVWPTTLPGTPA